MYNDWFTIGGLTIHGYGVMIGIGILAAFWLASRLGKRFGLDTDQIDNIIFVVLAAGYAGAKLTYCLVNWNQFITDPLSVLGSGGWVVYGGIICGFLGGYLYCRKKNLDFMKYFNVMIPCASLAQGFGRIGCFLAGCCYGKQTSAWYGVTFPAQSLGPGEGISVIPTQLISSAGDFLLMILLYLNLTKGKHPEYTGGYYLMGYSLGRFFIEFLRGDTARGFFGALSTSQVIAVFTFLLGAWLINRRQKEGEQAI